MRSSILVGTACLLLGLVFGFGLANLGTNDVSESSSSTASSTTALGIDSTHTRSQHSSSERVALSVQDNATEQSIGKFSLIGTSFSNSHQSVGFSDRMTFMQQVAGSSFDTLEREAEAFLNLAPSEAWQHLEGFHLVISRMVELDADLSFEFFKRSFTSNLSERNFHWLHTAVTAVSRTHHTKIIDWLDSLPANPFNHEILQASLVALAKSDPVAALELYKAKIKTNPHDGPAEILRVWAQTDPESAMNWVLSQDVHPENHNHAMSVFSSWTYTDKESAAIFLASVTNESLRSAMDMQLFEARAIEDPRSALEEALNQSDYRARMQKTQAVISNWGYKDPLEAINYVKNQLSGEDQDRAFQILASSMEMGDTAQLGNTPLEILQESAAFPDIIRISIEQQSIQTYFQEDPHAAIAWIDTKADENEREVLLELIAWQIPEHDLYLAQSMYEQSTPQVQNQLGHGIIEQLYNTDPAAAWQWYEQQSKGDNKEFLRYALIERLAQSDPHQALQLASTDTSGESRDIMAMIFFEIAMNDRAVAQEWLNQASLDDITREQMEQFLTEAATIPYGSRGIVNGNY